MGGIYADDRLGSKYLYDGPFDSERDAKIEINRLMYNSPLSVREAGNLYVEPYDPRYKKVHGRWAIYEKAPSGNGKSMVDGPFKSKKEAERGINRLKYNSPIPMHEVAKFWVGPYDPRYDV